MTEAFIVDAVRTAVGKRNGGFAAEHPADMAAHVIKTVVGRHDVDPAAIDDVILGCLDNIGSQAGDIARTAALAAGLPESVPGVTIDRQCGSAQQAVHFAAQAVMSGTSDLIVAGGVQKMSQFPILSAFAAGEPFGSTDPWTGCRGWQERFGDQEISQFRGAEMIASQWKLSREDNERFALESHQRALAAIAEGRFEREISPYAGVPSTMGPRANTSLEKMATLPTLTEGGVLTAAVASQISDGAAALLIASQDAVDRFGLTPRARIHHMSVRGRRSGDDADGTDTGDPARAQAHRHVDRRHRRRRDQRGVRSRRPGLAGRTRSRPQAGQPQRRGDRARASDRLHRRAR